SLILSGECLVHAQAGSSVELPAHLPLPVVAAHVVRAIDPPRGDELPAMNHTALTHRETAVVTRAHRAELLMNPHLLPLKACVLSRSKAAIPESVVDALLLVELTLHDRALRLFVCGCLGKCKGRRCAQCRHKHISK